MTNKLKLQIVVATILTLIIIIVLLSSHTFSNLLWLISAEICRKTHSNSFWTMWVTELIIVIFVIYHTLWPIVKLIARLIERK